MPPVDDARPGEVVRGQDGLRGHAELRGDSRDRVTARDRIGHRGAARGRGGRCFDYSPLARRRNGCHTGRPGDRDGLTGVDDAGPGQPVGAQERLRGEPEFRGDSADRVALLDGVATGGRGGDGSHRSDRPVQAERESLSREDHGLPTEPVEGEHGSGGQAVPSGDTRDGVARDHAVGGRSRSDGDRALRHRSSLRIGRGSSGRGERVTDALAELRRSGPWLVPAQVGRVERTGDIETHRHRPGEHDRDGGEETADDPVLLGPSGPPSTVAVVALVECFRHGHTSPISRPETSLPPRDISSARERARDSE